MNDLTLPANITSTNLALPSGGRSKSIAVIQAPLRPHAQVFNTANLCEKLAKGSLVKADAYSEAERLPNLVAGYEITASSLENMAEASRNEMISKAKTIRRLLSPLAVRMDEALPEFDKFINPGPENYIDPAQASVMVHGLVGAIAGKKRSDEDQAKLDAMLLMFDPTINAIGSATEIWKDIPQHPVVVSLAILGMMFNTQTFCPAPAELAEASLKARGRLRYQHRHMEDLMQRLCGSEDILFAYDREAWASLYTTKENVNAGETVLSHLCFYKKYSEMCEAFDEIKNEMIHATIRKAIGSNGKADVVKIDVQEEDAVPPGVTLQPIPIELVKKLPDCSSDLEHCRYFLTPQNIVMAVKK